MTPGKINRRQILQTVAAIPAAAAPVPQPPQRSAAATPFVGIQMGPHSMLDEGIERVLDRLQGECGINSLLVYSHTYYTADGIRRKRTANVLAQDHGVPARDRARRTFFNELTDRQALDLFYTLKGYDEKVEPALEELDQKGLGPDYVYRETRRVVQDVAGRAKVYSGIGIDIPGNGGTFASNPDGVYQATRRAFEAGAAGVLISREYDEMRLPNLRAVGRAIGEMRRSG
jgi:hypothetical protein